MDLKIASFHDTRHFLLLLFPVVLIGLIVFGLTREESPITISEASLAPEFTISSLEQISVIASQFTISQTFTVKIPTTLYKQVYIIAARAYCTTQTTMCGEPFDARFVGPQNIWSTFAYGVPFERKPVNFNYYYYIGSGAIVKTKVTQCTIAGKKCSNAEKGTIQLAMDQVSLNAWYIYRNFLKPQYIRNDVKYLFITFKVTAAQ